MLFQGVTTRNALQYLISLRHFEGKHAGWDRFKKCLGAGMKVSWVLSDEERNR